MFLMDQFLLAIFVEGHLVTISAKLFSNLTTGFRREDDLHNGKRSRHLAAMFLDESNFI